ncbi:MAG TPA: methyl-accepting chemotaxis protein, partial [Azospirillaceae bacterium]|nr:methyl-accepting chemotaxis protein [Azospirillaceae bacterium]
EETTAAAQSMATQAGDLRSMVAFFQMDAAMAQRVAAAVPAKHIHTPPKPAAPKPTPPKPATHKPTPHKPAAKPPVHHAPRPAPAGVLKRAAVDDDDEWKEF